MTGTAVVTGASSGIGEAFARRLAADGYDLILVARRTERIEALGAALRAAHGVATRAVTADLSAAEDLDRLCTTVESATPDVLVNSAGLAHYMPFVSLPTTRARDLVELNALAPVLLSRTVVPAMVERGGGAVVNVASLLAFSGAVDSASMPERAVYAATKSFLVTFSRILASEVRGSGVLVQVLCPGMVRSEFHSRQGMSVEHVPRMEPELVVEASLADLAAGVEVSVPGLEDTGALERLDAAAVALLGASLATELPGRYLRRG